MFRKILVAVDRSPAHRSVFTAGLELAKATGASLMLLQVPSVDDPACPHLPTLTDVNFYPLGYDRSITEIYEELWQSYTNKGLDFLRSLAEEAQAAGVTVEYTQNPGNPGEIICDLARNLAVDMVVVGRRGHSGLSELILGSVSNYVLHHAPCAVLIIQRNPSEAPPEATPTESATAHS